MSIDTARSRADIAYVLRKLDWMRSNRIWPNGRRYLWTDAFGLVLLVSLYQALGDRSWLDTLDRMWQPAGYFCREPCLPETKFAFTNYGVAVGLQAVNAMPGRVRAAHAYFEDYRSGDEYDRAAITHVMDCSAHFPGCLIRNATTDSPMPAS